MARLWSFLPWKRRKMDQDLERELRHHIDRRAADFEREGTSPAEARRRAAMELGGMTQVRENVRDTWTLTWISHLFQDTRYALRDLLRNRSFALAAIATLGLAIGANTAIFSVIRGVLLKPLPYHAPKELVMVWQDMRARGGPVDEWATPGNLVDWRAQSRVFASMASVRFWAPPLTEMGDAVMVAGEQVTQAYFDVLGVQPAFGRAFRPEETVPNAPRVAIVSHRFWLDRLGGSQDVLEKSVVLAGESHQIIGVMPPDFRPVVNRAADIWRPDRLNLASPSRGAIVLRVVARLQPSIGLADAQIQMDAVAKDLGRQHPETSGSVGVNIVSLHERVVGDVRPGMLLLLGAVVLVLVIACVNIASLLLARAASRVREMAVRVALGAARGRVVRQLLTESAVLAILGGVTGVAISYWVLKAFVAMAPAGTPRLDEVSLDAMVLVVSAALTMLTGFLFGLAPAIQLARANHTPALKEGGRGSSGAAGHRVRRALVVAEIAISLMLLVGGGLLMRSFAAMQRADLGFVADGLMTAFVQIPPNRFTSPAEAISFKDRVLDRVSLVTGVTRAAWTSILPLAPRGDNDMDFAIEGVPPPPPDQQGNVAWFRVVSADYLSVMGMRIRSGRLFNGREPEPTVVVSQTLAARYWPGVNPVGQRVRLGSPDDDRVPWFTIVGVVDDVHQQGARVAARGQVFIPYWHAGPLATGPMNLVLATDANEDVTRQALTQAMRELDPRLPVTNVMSMTALIGQSVEEPRFLAAIASVFAALAMLLAAVGVYGVTASAVSAREQEISVRLALGATRTAVFGLLFKTGMILMLAGLVIGSAGAAALAPMLATLLYGLEPLDILTFIAMSGVLLIIAGLAVLIPTVRASRLNPGALLRG